MNEKIVPLSREQHKALRLSTITSFDFARNIASVKLSFSELRHASPYYPIVFLDGGQPLPQALLSLEPDKNLFVDDKGNWKVPYIPAYFRLYPFMLATVQDQEEKLALCIDPEAEHFKSGMGDPLFTADGELTESVQKILKALEAYQKEIVQTRTLFSALDAEALIVDRAYNYRIGQEEKNIRGFKGIDMKKLHDMDDAQLGKYVKNGTMKMVYEVNDSLSNFSRFIAPAQK